MILWNNYKGNDPVFTAHVGFTTLQTAAKAVTVSVGMEWRILFREHDITPSLTLDLGQKHWIVLPNTVSLPHFSHLYLPIGSAVSVFPINTTGVTCGAAHAITRTIIPASACLRAREHPPLPW